MIDTTDRILTFKARTINLITHEEEKQEHECFLSETDVPELTEEEIIDEEHTWDVKSGIISQEQLKDLNKSQHQKAVQFLKHIEKMLAKSY